MNRKELRHEILPQVQHIFYFCIVNQSSLPTGSLHVPQYSPPKVTIKLQAAFCVVLAVVPTAAGGGEGVTSLEIAVADAAGVCEIAAAVSDGRGGAGESKAM